MWLNPGARVSLFLALFFGHAVFFRVHVALRVIAITCHEVLTFRATTFGLTNAGFFGYSPTFPFAIIMHEFF